MTIANKSSFFVSSILKLENGAEYKSTHQGGCVTVKVIIVNKNKNKNSSKKYIILNVISFLV